MHHDSTTNYTGLPVCAMMTEGETCNPRRNINCKDDNQDWQWWWQQIISLTGLNLIWSFKLTKWNTICPATDVYYILPGRYFQWFGK